jgi:hypothetical protein
MRSTGWLCACVFPPIFSFSMRSVSYQRKVGDKFFLKHFVIITDVVIVIVVIIIIIIIFNWTGCSGGNALGFYSVGAWVESVRNIGCPERGFHGFPQFLQENVRILPQLEPNVFPENHFQFMFIGHVATRCCTQTRWVILNRCAANLCEVYGGTLKEFKTV